MARREISGCKFDDGFSALIYDENLHNEGHPPQPHSNQDKQQVSMHSTTPRTHCRLAAVSLTLLAVVLLIVDIGLGVHYTNLKHYDTEDIGKELANLQVMYETAVEATEGARKQLDNEMGRQTPTNWELEHQNKRSKNYEVQINQMNTSIDALRYNLPMINAGCTHCTPGWILMNSMCYYFAFSDNIRKSWQKAREYCQVHGGDLAVLDSKDKENATVNFLMFNTLENPSSSSSYTTGRFWIGLRNFPKEGTWKWVNGRALVEGYWRDGEPNSNVMDSCGIVSAQKNFFTAWSSFRCESNQKWICEKTPIS